MSGYFMHNQKLESVDAAKYLGVSISKDLSWNTHISNITTSANRTLSFVKRNVLTKNKDLKTMAYKSHVRPQLEYASAVLTQKKIKVKLKKFKEGQPDEYQRTTPHIVV